jgi:hypothetical protein
MMNLRPEVAAIYLRVGGFLLFLLVKLLVRHLVLCRHLPHDPITEELSVS